MIVPNNRPPAMNSAHALPFLVLLMPLCLPCSHLASAGEAGSPAPRSSRPAAYRIVERNQHVTVGRELYGGGRGYFDGELAEVVVTNVVLSGEVPAQPDKPERFDGKATWREYIVPRMSKAVSVAAWIKIAGTSKEANDLVSKGEWNQAYSLGLSNGRLRWAINGTVVQTEQPLALGQWLHVVGTFDGQRMCAYVDGQLAASRGSRVVTSDRFSRKADGLPGQPREAAVMLRAVGADGLDCVLKPRTPVTLATSVLSDLDAKHPAATATELVAGLTPAGTAALSARHRAWWTDFWARSFIEIPDPEIEKRWYAALYVMGGCSRPGKVAPGLWGNWLTTDHPNWHGDFHLNYNFQAPFSIVYGANHADLSLPFYQAIWESVPNGRAMARRRGWRGVHFPVCIGPWGLSPENPDGDWGQRSNAAYAALNFIWYWQYTQDLAWLKNTGYPYLREVAEFWEHYLKIENGRYVISNDAIHEGSGDQVFCASPGGAGPTMDFLSAAAMDFHFQKTAAILIEDAGPLAGKTLKYFHDDSWEVGLPNWTDSFLDDFRKYRGYDARPYLPVLAGVVVGGVEISDRFLYDYRRTVADCIANNHYARFAELAHAKGVQIHCEGGGPCYPKVPPLDALMNLGRTDVPMGEFRQSRHWKEKGQNIAGKQTAAAAHIYGKTFAAAEAFTKIGPHWEECPADLKPTADIAFCEGINRFFLHTWTSTRPEDGVPGHEYFAGTHFNRNVTWWPQAGAFFTYISRCQHLLQQGLFVADVCYCNGDNAPNKVEVKHADPSLGPGCSTRVCLGRSPCNKAGRKRSDVARWSPLPGLHARMVRNDGWRL